MCWSTLILTIIKIRVSTRSLRKLHSSGMYIDQKIKKETGRVSLTSFLTECRGTTRRHVMRNKFKVSENQQAAVEIGKGEKKTKTQHQISNYGANRSRCSGHYHLSFAWFLCQSIHFD